ncbi:hypothetical protein [Streptomyces avicenniae]|uniref:hypothetical protein n=1 Tax=Streptomyces avicenniae TaxID=500153 RepID=UPI000699882E|nr:hypothetical protein [Streptomyces avicenniae]
MTKLFLLLALLLAVVVPAWFMAMVGALLAVVGAVTVWAVAQPFLVAFAVGMVAGARAAGRRRRGWVS